MAPSACASPRLPVRMGSQAGPQLITFPQGCRCWGVASILSLSLDCAPRAVPAQKGEYRVAPAQTPQPLRCRPVLPSLLSPHQAKGRPGAQTSEAHPAKAAQPFLHQAAWASPDPPRAPLEQGRPPGSCAAGPLPACPSLSGSSVLGHWLCQAEPPRQRQHAGGPGSEGAEPAGRAGEGPPPRARSPSPLGSVLRAEPSTVPAGPTPRRCMSSVAPGPRWTASSSCFRKVAVPEEVHINQESR